jgi:hypothetical protein
VHERKERPGYLISMRFRSSCRRPTALGKVDDVQIVSPLEHRMREDVLWYPRHMRFTPNLNDVCSHNLPSDEDDNIPVNAFEADDL